MSNVADLAPYERFQAPVHGIQFLFDPLLDCVPGFPIRGDDIIFPPWRAQVGAYRRTKGDAPASARDCLNPRKPWFCPLPL